MIYGDLTQVPICLHHEPLMQTFPKASEGSSVLGVINKGLGKALENLQQGTIKNDSPGNQLTLT